jgi:hypothetical protein
LWPGFSGSGAGGPVRGNIWWFFLEYPVIVIKYPVVVITYPAVWSIPPDFFRLCVRQQSLKLSTPKKILLFWTRKYNFIEICPEISLFAKLESQKRWHLLCKKPSRDALFSSREFRCSTFRTLSFTFPNLFWG